MSKEIRQSYATKEYRSSKEFFQPIPALDIYKKYDEYLKDYNDSFK